MGKFELGDKVKTKLGQSPFVGIVIGISNLSNDKKKYQVAHIVDDGIDGSEWFSEGEIESFHHYDYDWYSENVHLLSENI